MVKPKPIIETDVRTQERSVRRFERSLRIQDICAERRSRGTGALPASVPWLVEADALGSAIPLPSRDASFLPLRHKSLRPGGLWTGDNIGLRGRIRTWLPRVDIT